MNDTTHFHVSPQGRDDGPGTLADPFATLDRARRAVRALKSDKPVTVLLRGGTYALRLPVVFGSDDSGTEQAPITYAAYPGEKPILSGGMAVDGWTRHRDDIYQAELPDVQNLHYLFRQLFFDGRRQIRARYPNHDPGHPQAGGWAFIESAPPWQTPGPATFTWEKGMFPRRWSKPHLGEVFVIPGLAWNSHIIPIVDVDHDQRTVRLSRRMFTLWDGLVQGNRFYVENLLEELDQPGEWCFDRETRTLYFWPPDGQAPQDGRVTIPMTDKLVELRATAGRPVRHLRFEGLTFTQSLSGHPHFMPLHHDYIDCNRPLSAGWAMHVENAEHCVIEGCTFDQVGGDAIRLHGYNGHHRIARNTFVGCGAQAICLAHLDFWPYDFPPVWRDNEAQFERMSSQLPWAVGNTICGNHIHHCGVIDNFGAAIHVHGMNTRDNRFCHNHVHDQPHHAIYFSMGFGHNHIEYNDLHDLCYVMADAGGVYHNRWSILPDDPVLGKHNVVRHNLIQRVNGVHHAVEPVADATLAPPHERIRMPHFTWGMYYDNSPRRAHVYGNITVGNVWGGIFLGGGFAEPADNLVENNIFIDSMEYQFDLGMSEQARGNRFLRNIVVQLNPEAWLLRATTLNGVAECDHNVYFAGPGVALRCNGLEDPSFESWRKLGYDAHSVVADPLFVDAANGDYRLQPDSPALKLGFQQIPVDRIGIAGIAACHGA